ncbi:MBOAT family O-acyltransferase [Bacteroides sp.]|uniref:MBOAT family O-acyltransferase n=1 Tax=Bacteroides sp. TaxID=29523 RepID=UPI002582BA8D|nr:MBOAT family O-acyltransferase [Bacteroides sp.]
MLFNSFEFLIYLPIVFILYWFVFNKTLKLQNLLVVVVSYIFYGWWDWRFLLLIGFTTLCSYLSGILIASYEGRRKLQKAVSICNIVLNLTILGIFKYFNFFADNFAILFRSFGYEINWVTLDILLPVGISFYTFQALSYSIDVYQKKIEPTKDIIAFFAFISFFPQLVAGPIERATNLLPQFLRERKFDYSAAVDGCRQMLWGFFKKIVIADNCAVCVNSIFENYTELPASTLLLGGFWFTFQIYCDFSGYSDIAIGCAKLFGIKLMKNFNFPYFSRDIAEFWRRWHISLTTWFRDYIYIPLGGSRVGKWKAVRNTMIIFLVSGFWHGANWTFIVWGVFHALLFLPLLLGKRNRKNLNSVAHGKIIPSFKELAQMLTTFIFALVGWIIFRAENIFQAYDYITRMFNKSILNFPERGFTTGTFIIPLILIFILIEWIQREKNHGLEISLVKSRPVRYLIYSVLIYIILIFTNEAPAEFIYFQF